MSIDNATRFLKTLDDQSKLTRFEAEVHSEAEAAAYGAKQGYEFSAADFNAALAALNKLEEDAGPLRSRRPKSHYRTRFPGRKEWNISHSDLRRNRPPDKLFLLLVRLMPPHKLDDKKNLEEVSKFYLPSKPNALVHAAVMTIYLANKGGVQISKQFWFVPVARPWPIGGH